MSLRPALRQTNSSPHTSTNSIDTVQNTNNPATATDITQPGAGMSSHISIQTPPTPEREKSTGSGSFGASTGSLGTTREQRRRSSGGGGLTPGEIHAALHGHEPGHAYSNSGGSGIGFPRTSTQGSAGEGRYRRKVGFEAFEAGPDTLFAYTSQVSRVCPSG